MKYYTLLQLNQSIARHLKQIEQECWIIAEIANVQYRKHYYLDLVQKEEDDIVAKAKAVIWANRIPYLRMQLGSSLEQLLQVGIKVLIRVGVSYHEVYGLMLVISEIELNYTIGELAAQKKKTIERLQEKQLLAIQKNLKRPLVLQRIAVISSVNAAGWKDFQHQLLKNSYGFRFVVELFDAQVQGEKALEELLTRLAEIEQRATDFDCVVLIRGGGTTLDLEVFNQYTLAEKIALFPLPVLVGIGHQTDHTVCDWVAHLSFKTPTAVADFLIEQALQLASLLVDKYRQILQKAIQLLQDEELFLHHTQTTLQKKVENILQKEKLKIHTLPLRLEKHIFWKIQQERNQLEKFLAQIAANDPKKILEKGYSLLLKDGKPVSSVRQLYAGDRVVNWLSDGKVESTIEQVRESRL